MAFVTYVEINRRTADGILLYGCLAVLFLVTVTEALFPSASRGILLAVPPALLFFWFADRGAAAEERGRFLVRSSLWLPGLLFLSLVGAQSIPMPQPWAAVISPHMAALKGQATDVLHAVFGGTFSGTQPMRLAYYAFPSQYFWTIWLACAVVFFLVLNTARSWWDAEWVFWAVVGAASVKTAADLIRQPDSVDDRMLSVAVLVLLARFAVFPQRKREPFSLKRVLAGKWSRERQWMAAGLSVLVPLWLFCSGAAARLGVAAALCVGGCLFMLKKGGKRIAVPMLAVAVSMLFFLAVPGDMPGSARQPEKIPSGNGSGRLATALEQHPLSGVGWHNFRLPFVNGSRSAAGWPILVVETGWPGVVLLAAMAAVFFWGVIRQWFLRQDHRALRDMLGSVMALAFVAGYSALAGSHGSAGLLLTCGILSAAGFSSAYRHGRGLRERVVYPTRPLPRSFPGRVAVTGTVLASVLLFWTVSLPMVAADILCPAPALDPDSGEPRRPPGDVRRAALFAPGRADTYVAMGNMLASAAPEAAAGLYATALIRNPAESRGWLGLGRLLAVPGTDAYDYVHRRLHLADRCFDQAVFWNPEHAGLLFEAAAYWALRSRILPPGEDRRKAIEQFQELFRRAITLDASLWREAVRRLLSLDVAAARILDIIPEGRGELKSGVMEMLVRP